MAYSATINDEVFFSTDSISPALGLSSAVLDKKAGAAGLFSFTVLPNNKFYDDFHLIEDYIDVYRNEDLLWSGRVTHVSQAFDLSKKIEAQGLLSILNDTIFRPILHEGTLYQLLSLLIASHNSQVEAKKRITLGTIDISDAACYRAYENYETTYSRFSDLVESFGGYLSIRKVDNTLYLDWKEITAHSVQTVDFGENLLDITKASDTENYISVLIPLGAQIEDEETGERYRVTIESVNEGRDYISVPYATNKIVGVQSWDDVNEPLILLHKGEAWLAAQNILKTKIDVTAIDLADCGYNINNFDVGMVIGVTSRPHSLDNQTFECLEQSLDLLAPDKDKLTLGGVVDGFTIRSQKEARMNTRIIERIDANYTTNKRLNDIRTLLNQDIQENYTLIEQNSESIVLLSEQVQNVAHVFYNYPVPPYSQGDLWYAGTKRSAIPGYAIPGYSIPSETEEIYICNVAKTAEQSFDRSDWQRVYGAKFNMIETLNRRVTTAEINIDAANGRIDLNASDIDNLNDDISSVEIAMDALNTELTLKVDKTDYNAAEIALMINDSGSTIKIQADHISLEGVVTANNYFKILSDGSMEAVNGSFSGNVRIVNNTLSNYRGETVVGTGTYYCHSKSSGEQRPSLQVQCYTKYGNVPAYLAIAPSANVNYELVMAANRNIEIQSNAFSGTGFLKLYLSSYALNMHYGINSSYPTQYPFRIDMNSKELYMDGTIHSSDYVRCNNISNHTGTVFKLRYTTQVEFDGSFSCTGAKKRSVKTKYYGTRDLTCYETAYPMFGDVGFGETDDTGEAIISIDDILNETIRTDIAYHVFIQAEGTGDIYVADKKENYFIVRGTPNLRFSWEVKAVQRDFELYYMDEHDSDPFEPALSEDVYGNYLADAMEEEITTSNVCEDSVELFIKEQEDLLYETA